MRSKLFVWVIILGLITFLTAAPSWAEWQPSGPIKLMIAFAAGGGADTQARLVAEGIQARYGWKFIPEQVTGKGGINLLKSLKGAPNDGTVIGMIVSEALGYNLVVAEKAGVALEDFTPLTSTAAFEMGIVAKTSKGWKTFHDVVKAAKAGETIRFGVMSPKLADLAYLLGKANGIEFNIVMLKGGKAVMNGLNAGDIDVGFVAGIQDKAVRAGDMVNLASGLSRTLKISPEAPLMKEFGVKFTTDGYFMFIAPAGLPDEARTALSDAIVEIVKDPSTKAGGFIQKAFGEADVVTGADLDEFLKHELEAAKELLKAASE